MDQPGKSDADAGADLQNPATVGYRRGECCQQSPHFDLAGELETGSGGSLVRRQDALGKLRTLGMVLALGMLSTLGHKDILPNTAHPA